MTHYTDNSKLDAIVDNMVNLYHKDPDTMERILINTTNSIKEYLEDDRYPARILFKRIYERNKLFINRISNERDK
mgnify:CR=1 FL=1